MELKGSLLCLQEPATGLYSEPDMYLSKFYFSIILPPTSRSSKLSLSFWLSHQNPIRIHLLPHACYIPWPSHPPWLDHSNYYNFCITVLLCLTRDQDNEVRMGNSNSAGSCVMGLVGNIVYSVRFQIVAHVKTIFSCFTSS
jgi:hypothetical protein